MPEATSTASDAKTNAILAWIFAPFTSFAWKDSTDEFVKAHARASLYLGIANVISSIVIFVLQICMGVVLGAFLYNSYLFGFAGIVDCFWWLLNMANGAFILIPRLIGVVKANNGEKWEVPYITESLKKIIKL
jgi:uncharacterized Tic20 family protein